MLRCPQLFLVRWLFTYRSRNSCTLWRVRSLPRIERFDKTKRRYILHTKEKTISVKFSRINVLKAFGEKTLQFSSKSRPWLGWTEVCISVVSDKIKRKTRKTVDLIIALLELTCFSLSTTVETQCTLQRSPWWLFDCCRHLITWSTQTVSLHHRSHLSRSQSENCLVSAFHGWRNSLF